MNDLFNSKPDKIKKPKKDKEVIVTHFESVQDTYCDETRPKNKLVILYTCGVCILLALGLITLIVLTIVGI